MVLLVVGFAGLAATAADPAPSFEATIESGLEAFRANEFRLAAERFREGTQLRPEDGEAWVKLGMALGRLEEWDAAIEAYENAIRLDPKAARAHHNLGNLYFRSDRFDEAATHYGQALAIDPDYLLAAFHYGWTLRQLGRSEDAEGAFRRCLEIPPPTDRDRKTHVDCLFGLGSIRHRAADYPAAANMMEQVVRLMPNHPEARYYLAMAYRQLGRVEEAQQQMAIHRRMLDLLRETNEVIERPDQP
jgi:tetratricopeptide (TPR) repeat protein